jgi:hypothetical protein
MQAANPSKMASLFPGTRYSAQRIPPPEGGPRKKNEPVGVRSVGSTYPSARRIAVMADKSRRAVLVYAMLAVTTIAVGAPGALAANAGGAQPFHEGPWPIRNGHNYQPTEQNWEPCMRMSRPMRRARSTDCTISSRQAAEKFAIDILHPHVDRAVPETDFFQLAQGLFVEAQI